MTEKNEKEGFFARYAPIVPIGILVVSLSIFIIYEEVSNRMWSSSLKSGDKILCKTFDGMEERLIFVKKEGDTLFLKDESGNTFFVDRKKCR